jgi:hypothetical protein
MDDAGLRRAQNLGSLTATQLNNFSLSEIYTAVSSTDSVYPSQL